MKILLIPTYSETVLTFRRSLIEALKRKGHEVVIIAHDDERKQEILDLGVSFYCARQNNRSINPFAFLQYGRTIKQIIHKEKPDAVFTFQLKPNTLGILAAKAAGVKRIYAMVEGAGDVFIKNSAKWKIIRAIVCLLYKTAFSHASKVFFLNEDDKKDFLARKLVKKDQAQIIPGIGVDLERFCAKPLKNYRNFLMVARMIRSKGVLEYCKCARLVKGKYPDAQFDYLGHESELTLADIQEYIDDGSVNYLGAVKDVRPFLENCSCLVLPSYREGMPMSIMEAEAVGRCIITYNTVGCKDTVVAGYNGFIVPQKDYEAMAEKCIYFIEHPEEAARMGENSRRFAEERFDQQKINQLLVLTLEGASENPIKESVAVK